LVDAPQSVKSGGTVNVADVDAVALVAARASSPRKALSLNVFSAATEVDLLITYEIC
jgi:predicted RecA/RadA family phage recombinase